jgi:hypothetical protein
MILHEAHQEVKDFWLPRLVLQGDIGSSHHITSLVDANDQRLDVAHFQGHLPVSGRERHNHQTGAAERQPQVAIVHRIECIGRRIRVVGAPFRQRNRAVKDGV